jgi:hypothetical protein
MGDWPEQVVIISGQLFGGEYGVASINTSELSKEKPEFKIEKGAREAMAVKAMEKGKNIVISKGDGKELVIAGEQIKEKFGEGYDKFSPSDKIEPKLINVFTGGKFSVRLGTIVNDVLVPYNESDENYLCVSSVDKIGIDSDKFELPDYLMDVNMDNYGGNDLMAICGKYADGGEAVELVAFFYPNINEPPTVSIASEESEIIDGAIARLPDGGLKLTAVGADPMNDALTYKWSCVDVNGGDCLGMISSATGPSVDFGVGTAAPLQGVDVSKSKDSGALCPYNIGVTATDAGGASAASGVMINCPEGAKAVDIKAAEVERSITGIQGGGWTCSMTGSDGAVNRGNIALAMGMLFAVSMMLVARMFAAVVLRKKKRITKRRIKSVDFPYHY